MSFCFPGRMDWLKAALTKTLPDISDELAVKVIEKMGNIEVTREDDLPLIEATDLLPTLNLIQARRLLQVWKPSQGSFLNHSCIILIVNCYQHNYSCVTCE